MLKYQGKYAYSCVFCFCLGSRLINVPNVCVCRLYDEVQRRDEKLLEAQQKVDQLQRLCVNLLGQLQV